MSSPAGVQFSQVDFLSRWMPSSSRAGVILSPNPDLAGSLRLLSPTLKPLKPDDSFSSDFAPLPASADSSCLVAEGCARSAGTERTEVSVYGGDEMEGNSQDLPLMMKLEQLRKWQQHMQQQLKAHQLEELLRLQEEQQRLLVKMNSSRDAAAAAADDSVGSDWEEEEEEEETTLPAASHHRRSPFSSNMNSSTCGLRQERHVSPAAERQRQRHRGQEVNDEDAWNSTDDDDDRDQSSVSSHHQDDDDTLTSGDVRKEDKLSQDRPIKPGIGGHKQTFEELLEEQLRLEEQRLKSARQQQNDDGAITSPAPPKRSFLKRGEGLSRFTNKSKASLKRKQEVKPQFKPPPQIRAIPRSSLAPGAQQRGATSCVQRKTAVINKENRPRGVRSPPHHDDAAQSKTTRTKVLGNDQRQNTDGSESVQTEPKLSQNHKTVGSEPQPSAGAERSSGSKVEAGGGAAGLETLELSLQRWECDRRRESAELGEFELLEQAAEELSFSSNSSFVLKVLQMDQQQRQLQAHGLHQRRLSSTPIKSPPSAPPQRSSSANGGVSVDSGAFELKNKASGEDEERQDEEENCEEEQEVSVKPPVFPAAFCFPQSKPPYDKRTYQDEDDDSNVDESTLMEDEDEDDNEQRRRVVFDDDDTWNDLEETSVDPHDDSRGVSPVSETMDAAAAASAPQMTTTMVRKVVQSKVVEVEKVPPPTTSQLMTRLFPSLRTKTQNTTTTPHLPHRRSAPLPPPESREPEEETVQQVQSRQLRERLVELEMEIDRFKRENAAVAKLRQDNEKTQENLRKERLEFERWMTEEQVKLEELKKEENKKLQKERKLFEKHVTAARAVPDKKEREEIQALKQQLSSLQEELRRKESRWTSTHGRLRQQIDSLSQDNAALQDQIHVLEKLRLSSWKKTSVPPEKETKDVSTTSTNVSSVTKGVKFASPLDSRAGSSVGPQNAVAASGRRSSGETSHNSTGMKSSLRRPSAPNTSSSCRRTQQKSPPPSSNSQDQDQDQDQDKPSKQEESNSCSTKRDFVPEEPERSDVEETGSVEEVITHPDGKVEKVLVGGDRLIVFPNGTKKEVSCDGRTVKVTFFNGDTKQITADHRVIYHYSDAQTTHITYPDGLEVLHFPNNQTEKLFPDGRKEITFPDQTVKTLFSDGREESVLTDGTIIQVDTDGTKHIHFNTGQKEIHTSDYKRREYPDGTVKTVYTDGRQETRYPTGRVRVKDKDGNVVTDTRV